MRSRFLAWSHFMRKTGSTLFRKMLEGARTGMLVIVLIHARVDPLGARRTEYPFNSLQSAIVQRLLQCREQRYLYELATQPISGQNWQRLMRAAHEIMKVHPR